MGGEGLTWATKVAILAVKLPGGRNFELEALLLAGAVTLPTEFDPLAWHRHEMLFGFVGAVIAGFLLTAVPNWTGRLPSGRAPGGGAASQPSQPQPGAERASLPRRACHGAGKGRWSARAASRRRQAAGISTQAA